MHIIPGLSVNDMPPPPTIEADVRRMGIAVYTLSSPGLRVSGQSTVSVDDEPIQLALSYSVLSNPSDPEDPANFVTNPELLAAAREGLREDRPAWFRERVLAMRYPALWEAIVSSREGVDAHESLEERLAGHLNHVAVNTLEDRRTFGSDGIPVMDHPVSAHHAHASELSIDGGAVPALILDSDPDLVGWAAVVGETTVLIAVDRSLVRPATVKVERLRFDEG